MGIVLRKTFLTLFVLSYVSILVIQPTPVEQFIHHHALKFNRIQFQTLKFIKQNSALMNIKDFITDREKRAAVSTQLGTNQITLSNIRNNIKTSLNAMAPSPIKKLDATINDFDFKELPKTFETVADTLENR
ncbi:MAG: hypothetical protein ACOCQR_00375 [bacterium]